MIAFSEERKEIVYPYPHFHVISIVSTNYKIPMYYTGKKFNMVIFQPERSGGGV